MVIECVRKNMAESTADESGRDPKELNNDWSAESNLWTAGFESIVKTEGNEARGEVPHVNVNRAVENHLRSMQDGLPNVRRRPESHDAEESVTFATDGVTMTVSLVADDEQVAEAFKDQDRFDTAEELVEGLFDGIREVVKDTLPEEWEEIEA